MWRIVITVVSVVLFSCAAFDLADANKLQKGMSAATVLDLVSKGPSKTFPISLPNEGGRKLEVMAFNLKNAGVEADYYAVFENDKLIYWGYPYEFNRYPDVRYNEIGRLAVSEAKNY